MKDRSFIKSIEVPIIHWGSAGEVIDLDFVLFFLVMISSKTSTCLLPSIYYKHRIYYNIYLEVEKYHLPD